MFSSPPARPPRVSAFLHPLLVRLPRASAPIPHPPLSSPTHRSLFFLRNPTAAIALVIPGDRPPPPPFPISILNALRPLLPSRCPPSLLPVHSHAIHHHRRNHRAARYSSHRNPRSRLFDVPPAPSPPRRVPSSPSSPQPHAIFIACRAAPWKSASTSSPDTASSPDCCPAVRRLDLLRAAPWKSASTAPQPSHLHVRNPPCPPHALLHALWVPNVSSTEPLQTHGRRIVGLLV